ncbi:hypothetical protein [Actinacidiphila glaucinigra]|nr:hypothetical protein [Actinacidiphila glaucinigra]
MSGRPRRKVLWGVAGTMTVAAAVVTTTAFVGPTDASAAARTTAVADEAAGNPVQGNGNRDNFGRLRTAEFLGVSVIVPSGTTQTVSARCPSRTEVTGGGFVLSSTDLAVLTSQRSGNGWTVTVRNRNGMTIPAPTARAVVECAAIVRDNNNW